MANLTEEKTQSNKLQPTPGPWEWRFEQDRDLGWPNACSAPVLFGPDGGKVLDAVSFHEDAAIASGYSEEVAEANANLISAAPEMLEALEEIKQIARRCGGGTEIGGPYFHIAQMAEAAIQKAGGQ